jgi:hypothetical protein
LLLSGCSVNLAGLVPASTSSSKPTASASVAPGAVVFSLGSGGGLCPDGPCSSTRKFYGDGRFSGGGYEGKIDAALVRKVATEVARADFGGIKSKPFKGTCPTAYDGQEVTYTFPRPGGGSESLGSCQYDLDDKHPLFKAVSAAFDASERALQAAEPYTLLEFKRRSGECYDGTERCQNEDNIAIQNDGSVSAYQTGTGPATNAKIDPALATALQAAIAKADFKALSAKPFTGECPRASGGKEDYYRFYTEHPYNGEDDHVENVAGCKVAIDAADPLFAAATKAVAAAEQALADKAKQ